MIAWNNVLLLVEVKLKYENCGPKSGPNRPKSGPKLGFLSFFLKLGDPLVFMEITKDDS